MPRININRARLEAFCQRWGVAELALFGSVLREDFRPDSDVDVLVEFEPDARISLFDMVEMQDELKALFGHKVDLVEGQGLRNPYRRHEILKSRQVIYAA